MLNNLCKMRVDKGLTQEYMAKELSVAISTYNQYENGIRNVPTEAAKKIANILETEVDKIFLPTKFTVSKFKMT